ncbi:hypothetical protein [Synechococcus phage Ssp-JY39]|nr:hypothetical protein [Synechococcus phage Yong-M2-251]
MTHKVFPLPEIVYPLDEATIGTMLARGSELNIYCFTNDCGHKARVNLVVLARKLGPDHSTLDPDLRPYFHCSKCRAAGRPDRKFGFIQHVLTVPHSKWPRQ